MVSREGPDEGKKRQAETLPLNRDRVSGPSFSVFEGGGGVAANGIRNESVMALLGSVFPNP